MDLASAGLSEQPFRTHGRPQAVVSYASQRFALKVLTRAVESPRGLALLQGPPLSGKSTLLNLFLTTLDDDIASAIVDAEGLGAAALLEAVLRGFGYEVESESAKELLNMIRVFALHQTASHEAPLLIVENSHELSAEALGALNELAELNLRGMAAIRLVLVSDQPLRGLLDSPEAPALSARLIFDFHLQPMSEHEVCDYLYTKLRVSGSGAPEFVFPPAVCSEIWQATGGWPGIVDRVALLALARTETLPVASESLQRPIVPEPTGGQTRLDGLSESAATKPRRATLQIIRDGKVLKEVPVDSARLLLGRADDNDITLVSKFVSQYHLLLVRNRSVTLLMDLNSTNGTFVNSKRVSNHVLAHDDVISIGHHRIRFSEPLSERRSRAAEAGHAETTVMKTLDDMRRSLPH